MTEQDHSTDVPDNQDAHDDEGSSLSTSESLREKPEDKAIPYHRFQEVNKAKRKAETELKKLQEEHSRREEERQQSQGEYKDLADKRQKKIHTLEEEVRGLKQQLVRDRRYRVWSNVASAHIKSGAIGDAFDMVGEDEWAAIDEDDEAAVKILAQNLAERKEYLAAGPIGAGSHGSKAPVFGIATNNKGKTGTVGSRPTLQFKKSRPLWKATILTTSDTHSRPKFARIDRGDEFDLAEMQPIVV